MQICKLEHDGLSYGTNCFLTLEGSKISKIESFSRGPKLWNAISHSPAV